MDEKYNGWTNRETWMVNLWIVNDEGLCESAIGAVKDNDPYHAGMALKDMIRELLPADGLAGDLVGVALSQVNWKEIADGLLEEDEEDGDAPYICHYGPEIPDVPSDADGGL